MVNGNNLVILLNDSIIARERTCTYSMQHADVETVGNDWRHRESVNGRAGWRLSCSGLLTPEYPLTDLLVELTRPLQLSFVTPDGNRVNGNGYCTELNIDASIGKAATYSLSFMGNGGFYSSHNSGFDYTFDFIFD